jgi:cytoskeleton protein RodZ
MAVKKDPSLVELLDGRGPGAHLRKVREEANMSVDKVATALLLHPHTVEAIEADAYEGLPAPTFVRGYLRGYARVLGLPSAPILEMFDRQGFEPPPLAPDVTESHQAHTSDTAVRLVTYAVAAVLVVLVALWWHSQEDGGFGISGDLFDWSAESDLDSSLPAEQIAGTETIVDENDQQTTGTASDGADPFQQGIEPPEAPSSAGVENSAVTAESVEPNEASRNEEPPVTADTGDPIPGAGSAAETESAETVAEEQPGAAAPAPSELSPNEEPAVTAPVEESAPDPVGTAAPVSTEADTTEVTQIQEATGTQDASADSDADTETDAGDASGDDAEAPESGSTEPPRDVDVAPAPGSEAARSGLVLEFTHESWVEVYDRERTRLFFGLVQPGRVLTFDAAKPYDVLLGFGLDVRVTIDGREFDHTPHLKHGVARFRVGAPEADLAEDRGH